MKKNQKTIFKNIETGVNSILILTLAIIFVSSMEALMMAKSKEIFEAYMSESANHTSSDYISYVLLGFISNIFEPIIISLYTFFTYKKYKVNNIYKFVFCSVIFVKMLNIALKLHLASIFYFILLVLYAILFFTIAYLPKTKKK